MEEEKKTIPKSEEWMKGAEIGFNRGFDEGWKSRELVLDPLDIKFKGSITHLLCDFLEWYHEKKVDGDLPPVKETIEDYFMSKPKKP